MWHGWQPTAPARPERQAKRFEQDGQVLEPDGFAPLPAQAEIPDPTILERLSGVDAAEKLD